MSRRKILIGVLVLVACHFSMARTTPEAENGVLDLSNWDLETDGTVDLNGDWGFYWGELLTSDEVSSRDIDRSQVFPFPGSWNGMEVDGEVLGNQGFATFTLQLTMPRSEEILALNIPPPRSSFALWANGKLIASSGKVGTTSEEYTASYSPTIVALSPEDNQLELVLQVANFHHRNGGPGFPIEIGTNDQIVRQSQKANLYEIFLLASLFVMALYHFGWYLLRRSEKSALYFALYCFISFLRVPLEGRYIFYQLYPGTDLEFWLRIDYLTFVSVGLAFCLFLSALFEEDWSKWATKVMWIGVLILYGIILFLPIPQSTWYIPLAQLFVLVGGIYCTYVLIRAMRNKRDGAGLMFFAVMIFILFYINDILYYSNQISTGVMTISASFFFIIVQAFLLSSRYSNAFSLTEVYASTFQKFVPVQFLDRIAKNGISSIALGNAEPEEAVILFSDIRGFTALSEQMGADEVFGFLNEYLSRMEPPVRQNHGFVDKYLGDAIMALFTHEGGKTGAANALRAAVGMKQALEGYNKERRLEGMSELQAGIGLHFGEVIIGTVGGGERMDSTAIGDSVNVASRIEGATKIYQVPILATDDVLQALEEQEEFRFRFMDRIRVVGRSEPIGIWEVVGLATDETDPEQLAQIALFEKATNHYFKQDFELALTEFQALLKLAPNDRSAQLYKERCRRWISNENELEWDAVTDLSHK